MHVLFQKAMRFIYQNARPLDFARWRYHFESGSAENVLSALSAYQNDDGGFGYGLEADCLNPISSPIQTWWATNVFREIGLFDKEHPMVSATVKYLESGDYFDGHCWAYSIPSNNDHPHAPWWHYHVPESDAPWDYNPSAALAGWLFRITGSDFANRLVREAINGYLSMNTLPEMHLLKCFLSLYRDISACAHDQFNISAFESKLRVDITKSLNQSADHWDSYCIKPSGFITGIDDPFYTCAPELAEHECTFIARTQLENGAWPITWQWSDYHDAFVISATRWQSHFIIANLLYLQGMKKPFPAL